ncbi:4-aminobutyrate aminotransferase [Anoxybacillus sp. BCO1]|nr:4-aminobutyrate aminotransferase [Anoxybacillus sp. BCO1]
MSNWMERRREAVARAPYNVTEIFIKEAKGAIIRDIDDREYIDFAGELVYKTLDIVTQK